MIMRIVLQIKSYANALGMKAITALLSSISGVRSVHVVSSGILSGSSPMSSSPADDSSSINENPSSELVVVRGGQSLDLDSSLATLRNLQLAQVNVIEQTSTTWTRKEVVLHIPDMMCPGNCGSSVLNALRVAEGVEAAKLLFERRQVVVRGDMHAEALCTTVADIGFDAQVVSKTLLPRRFRFRVDDLSDVGLHGLKLRSALEAVEGVETIVLLTDRAEVLVVATLLHANSIVKAAEAVGYEMLELSEEAWGIPMEVVPTAFGSDPTDSRVSENDDRQSHQCDMNICPHNGCPRYMTTVAHTAALAVGWAVPGCGMSVGGECTCGDGCKCDGCPEHNPIS
ncbi:hypothetical protein PHYBOEH_008278 [Phytophthora boehmeriae]|uniref:HMA domain-containing protein n=1 Tax=Phytophthora boehmeriae TaxID=109152 RepID=A0A8T1X195_9STRA|nr:hypothetical protein PHYBOEH_008278 [Phytophthora boehmeriae]